MPKTKTVAGRVPVPLAELLHKVADRRNTTVSRLMYRAAADVVADEFGVTTADGLEAARELDDG